MKRRAKSPSGRTRQKPTRQSRPPKPWALRDREMLGLVFQAFEDLTALRQRCARKVAGAREEEHIFGHLLWKPDETGLQRWSRISEIVTTSWRVLDQTVRTNRLDPAQCQESYRQMLWIRTVWVGLDPQADSLELLDQITDHLRQVLIRYAQALGQRRTTLP